MLKHKSFVINRGKKSIAKLMSMTTKAPCNSKPEIVLNPKDEAISGHYDENEKIELVLPQSLSYDDDGHNDEVPFYEEQNRSDAYALDYEEVVEEYDDNEENYSDANAYFEKENNFVKQQSNQSLEEENKPKLNQNETSKEEDPKAHHVVVINPDDILENESIIEQDKKFEEDIQSILSGKKQFDKARVARDPEEAIKNKNQGLFNKKDNQTIEDKLKNDHAIFDKIAQSMEMASSYDLGSIAMDKKFDILEKETDKDFNKKIHDIIEEDNPENKEIIEDAEIVNTESVKKEEEKEQEDQDKVETKDFLNDLDKLNTNETNHKKEVLGTLSTQSSFNSTISIRNRNLKSRVFTIAGNTVELMIDSRWTLPNCSELKELNVTLTRSVDYLPDDIISTKVFRIGGPDSKTWTLLQPGNYYLTFYFVNSTNPACELSGTIEVKA